MLFSSTVFLFVFLPAVLALYYIPLHGRRLGQNLLLLVASLLFYGWGEPHFLLVMVFSILMNYAFGLWVAQWKKEEKKLSTPVTVAIVSNLAILFVFKYLVFTVESLNGLGLNLPIPGIELPIGISFFTFQALSYVLDVARGKTEAQRSPLALGLYISFFPQLIAGPIVKYATVSEQISSRKENWVDFSAGCTRFIIGLGKKVLLANQFAIVADRVFGTDPAALSTPLAWLGSVCYTFQIYYDFSGYSDMAIGLGQMFGFHFEENFDHPYASRSITEFWRRWHISLSTWFRDYLYIPLGGNRVEKKRHILNLFIVWGLTGLWHGANWTFLLWGLLYAALLVAEKYLSLGKGWPEVLQRLYALLAVNFLWMLFRSDTLSYAGEFFLTMLGLNGSNGDFSTAALYLRENAVVLVLAVLFSGNFARWLDERLNAFHPKGHDLSSVWVTLYAVGMLCVAVLSAAYLVKGTHNPFIYFRF